MKPATQTIVTVLGVLLVLSMIVIFAPAKIANPIGKYFLGR